MSGTGNLKGKTADDSSGVKYDVYILKSHTRRKGG